mmetsp:Transcript_14938/g.59942  ORF Transcript_14938/g.59942 Transcript_14938/m.59942 type:complete len:465 (-) Transcript_14938:32-1426(-)
MMMISHLARRSLQKPAIAPTQQDKRDEKLPSQKTHGRSHRGRRHEDPHEGGVVDVAVVLAEALDERVVGVQVRKVGAQERVDDPPQLLRLQEADPERIEQLEGLEEHGRELGLRHEREEVVPREPIVAVELGVRLVEHVGEVGFRIVLVAPEGAHQIRELVQRDDAVVVFVEQPEGLLELVALLRRELRDEALSVGRLARVAVGRRSRRRLFERAHARSHEPQPLHHGEAVGGRAAEHVRVSLGLARQRRRLRRWRSRLLRRRRRRRRVTRPSFALVAPGFSPRRRGGRRRRRCAGAGEGVEHVGRSEDAALDREGLDVGRRYDGGRARRVLDERALAEVRPRRENVRSDAKRRARRVGRESREPVLVDDFGLLVHVALAREHHEEAPADFALRDEHVAGLVRRDARASHESVELGFGEVRERRHPAERRPRHRADQFAVGDRAHGGRPHHRRRGVLHVVDTRS